MVLKSSFLLYLPSILCSSKPTRNSLILNYIPKVKEIIKMKNQSWLSFCSPFFFFLNLSSSLSVVLLSVERKSGSS